MCAWRVFPLCRHSPSSHVRQTSKYLDRTSPRLYYRKPVAQDADMLEANPLKWRIKFRERRQTAISLGKNGLLARNSPIDLEIRIVPDDTHLVGGTVIGCGLEIHFGARSGRDKAMGEAWGDPKKLKAFFTQIDAYVLTICM